MRFCVLAVLLALAPACGLMLDPDDPMQADGGGMDSATGDARPDDAPSVDGNPADAPTIDTGQPDGTTGCVAVSESCNGFDDDCDGSADEGFDTSTDVFNCGGCGTACTPLAGQMAQCVDGACAYPCIAGFADCNGSEGDGCEADLNSPTSCGACGSACSGGFSCEAGMCVTGCDGGTTACGASCVDLDTSTAHCGTCGNACSASSGVPSCSSGTCIVTCTGSYADCDMDPMNGCESDINTDVDNCGACGAPCGVMQRCNAGTCVTTATPRCTTLSEWRPYAMATPGECVGTCMGHIVLCDGTPSGCECDGRSCVTAALDCDAALLSDCCRIGTIAP